jgi:hypothetical protein
MIDFLRQLFSESGVASFSRTGAFIALIFSCLWVTYVVWHNGSLPGLDGLSIFIGTLYGLGKAGETVQQVLGKK